MIIILEGNNGVGKSTYAKALSDHLGLPIVRPFRNSKSNLHWGYKEEGLFERLRDKLKVPVNTHVDDLYVADFLANFQMGAILDRSLPSAIVYGILHGHDGGWYTQEDTIDELMGFWLSLIQHGAGPLLYLWLRAPYALAQERCRDRWCPNERQYVSLESCFAKLFQEITINKRQINVADVEIKDGIKSIMDWIR